MEKGADLAFPDSAVSYFSGMMGQPAGGFPKDLQKAVLKGKKPIACRPGELLPPADFEEKKKEMLAFTDTLPVPRYNHKGLIELLLDLLRSLLLVGLLRLLLVPVFSNDPF